MTGSADFIQRLNKGDLDDGLLTQGDVARRQDGECNEYARRLLRSESVMQRLFLSFFVFPLSTRVEVRGGSWPTHVALVDYAPEELVAQAEQEFRRAVPFEGIEGNRIRSVPPLLQAATTGEFVARNQKAETRVWEFLERREILTLRTWLQHFTLRPLPPYLGGALIAAYFRHQ
jgi:hypothetical protein